MLLDKTEWGQQLIRKDKIKTKNGEKANNTSIMKTKIRRNF